jgi:hypothetical protein
MTHPYLDIINQLNIAIKNNRVSGRIKIKRSSLKVLLFLHNRRYISLWHPSNFRKIEQKNLDNETLFIEVFFYIVNNQNLLLAITAERINCSRKLNALNKYSPNLTCVEVLETSLYNLLTAEECREIGCGGKNPFFIYL